MLRTFLILAALLTSAPCASASPPNIVLIISDDQAWTDYGFMGHPAIRTPNLDRLAARSAVFRRGYTPTPLCRPSLMSIITGRYAHQHGVTGNDPRREAGMSDDVWNTQRTQLISRIADQPTLPKLLGASGYLSLQTGKWWEGHWKTGGFTHGMTRGFPEQGGRHGDDGLEIGRTTMQPVYDFIAEASAASKPFFIWYAPMLPHTPHDPPERLLAQYRATDRPEALAKYFAMCEYFDESCGQLLTHLDDRGFTDNTIVIYVTDNGWIQATPDMKLGPDWKQPFAPRSKNTPYESGIRTPVMISWPGVVTPADRPELVSNLDVFPTVLDAIGLDHPQHEAGASLLPLLRDNTPLQRDALCGECYTHDVADLDQSEVSLLYRWCIRDNWKLIVRYESPPDRYAIVHAGNDRQPQLFDLATDPHETTSVVDKHADIVLELAARLQQEWTVSKPVIELDAKK